MLLQDTPFSVSTDISYVFDEGREFKETDPMTAIFELIEEYGGELKRDNFNIVFHSGSGADNDVLIQYGKNLKGIIETINTDNIITRVYPVGASGLTLPEKYVDSDFIDHPEYPPFPIAKKVEFKDIADESTLREAASAYISENDKPRINYEIDFVELARCEEYKQYADLQKVSIGDMVIIRHERFDIDIKLQVIKYTKDVLVGIRSKIELGEAKPAFNIDRVKKEIMEEVDTKVTDLETRVMEMFALYADTARFDYTYTEEGDVARLTVDHLLTADITKRLEEISYIEIKDEKADWIVGYRKYDENGVPLPDVQLKDSEGNPLYWLDAEKKFMTSESVDEQGNPLEPVMVYQYDYETKMSIYFEDISYMSGDRFIQIKAPKIVLGYGEEPGTKKGKGYIYKDNEGIKYQFYNSNERLIEMKMNNNGIFFTPDLFGVVTDENTEAFTIDSSLTAKTLNIELGVDAHIFTTIIMTCNSNAPNTLNIDLQLDGESKHTALYQLPQGRQTVSLTLPIYTVRAGEHAVTVGLTSTDTVTVDAGDCLFYVESSGIVGGKLSKYPTANIFETLSYQTIDIMADETETASQVPNSKNISETISADDFIFITDEVNMEVV